MASSLTLPYLVVDELAGIIQTHILLPRRVVSRGQREAAQGVDAGAPLPDLGEYLLLGGESQGNPGVANADVVAALNDAFWGALLEKVWKSQDRPIKRCRRQANR